MGVRTPDVPEHESSQDAASAIAPAPVEVDLAGSAPAPDGSELRTALENAQLGGYAAKFDEKGYLALRDLGAKEDDARAAIEAVVNKATKPGDVARILRLWGEAVAPKPDQPKPVAAPKLTPGKTLDLTHPSVAIDDIKFEIPASVGGPDAGAAVVKAAELTPVQWLTIARNNALLYGINLERALDPHENAGFSATEAALVWKVPENLNFLDPDDSTWTEAALCYTSSAESLVHARMTAAALTVSAPYVGVTADASREERVAQSAIVKKLRMTGMWNYKRCALRMRFCTAPSEALIKDIEAALGRPDQDARFHALRDVFDRYGHVIPGQVVLGGQMYFQFQRDVTGTVREESVRDTVKVAVELKTPEAAGGGASASFDDGTGQKISAQQINQLVKWHCVGGDTTLNDKPGAWRDTVKNPNLWSVIARNELIPLADFLEPTLRSRVHGVWETGLKNLWAGFDPPEGWVMPPFAGQPFTIGNGKGSLAPVISGRNISPGKHGFPVAVTDGMDDPLGQGCLWRLVYSGRTDSWGQPLFWIVRYDRQYDAQVRVAQAPEKKLPVLAGSPKGDVVPRVCCFYTDEVFAKPQRRPGDNKDFDRTFWMLHKDWTGYRPATSVSLENFSMRKYISPPATKGQRIDMIGLVTGPYCTCTVFPQS